jgi:integrase
MAIIKLRYVESFKDRQGKIRHYFRRSHGPRVVLKGLPGSDEFMAAYQTALSQKDRLEVAKDRHAPGTFARLIEDYFLTPNFLSLKSSSQAVSRGIMERFAAEQGHRLVSQMKREHVLKLVGAKASTPAAANNFLKKLRVLIGFAIDTGVRKDDPTIRIKKFPEGEHHTWNDIEITQFEKTFPIGSFQRMAFALHLYTGQRRDDVRRMAWSDIEGDLIWVEQEKGDAKLYIPIHSELRLVLDKWPRQHVTMLVGSRGKPYTVESYGNLMADAIDAAGLPKRCVLHGVRKAAARRLAEAGCSANEIAAITGHKSLNEVERYTRAADQKILARSAIRRLPSTS